MVNWPTIRDVIIWTKKTTAVMGSSELGPTHKCHLTCPSVDSRRPWCQIPKSDTYVSWHVITSLGNSAGVFSTGCFFISTGCFHWGRRCVSFECSWMLDVASKNEGFITNRWWFQRFLTFSIDFLWRMSTKLTIIRFQTRGTKPPTNCIFLLDQHG